MTEAKEITEFSIRFQAVWNEAAKLGLWRTFHAIHAVFSNELWEDIQRLTEK